MTVFNIKFKEDTVYALLRNLLWGNISIDFEKFRGKQNVEEFADTFHKKLRYLQEYDNCPNDDGSPPEPTDWLYDAIFEGRVYGAIKGEFRDKTDEEKIMELEKEVENWKIKFEQQKSENIMLANELEDRKNLITSYEKMFPKKRD